MLTYLYLVLDDNPLLAIFAVVVNVGLTIVSSRILELSSTAYPQGCMFSNSSLNFTRLYVNYAPKDKYLYYYLYFKCKLIFIIFDERDYH